MGSDKEEAAPSWGAGDIEAAVSAGMRCAGVKLLEQNGAPFAAVPAGVELQDLQRLLPRPLRVVAARSFQEPDSFIGYVREFANPSLRVYGDADKLLFKAVLDGDLPDSPAWEEHTAELAMRLSPEWNEWNGAFGKGLNQTALAEFFKDHLGQIAEPAAADLLSGVMNFTASTNTKCTSAMREGGDINFNLHQETTGKTVSGKVPAELMLSIVPFRFWKPVVMAVSLSYRLKDGELSFVLRGQRAEELLVESLDNVRGYLEEALGVKVLI